MVQNNKTQHAAEFFIDVGKRKGAKWYLKYTFLRRKDFISDKIHNIPLAENL
ncbi:hypothetical protein EMIT036CA2_20814 [Chryseobacterium sp. IT-36CA2]